MRAVLKFSAARFGRAIIMPNLQPPITTTAAAIAYRERILEALPRGANFEPLMTLYLTDETAPQEIDRAKESGVVHGVKLYPAGATTHSAAGVTDIRRVDSTLARMERLKVPLEVHGEVTQPDVDVFDREQRFIDEVLGPLLERFPALPVVFEHITTARAVEFVRAARGPVAATITPQHLPILKRETDRQALVAAATSGESRFFLGTDSAPHERGTKETACGCAGMFTAHAALELYAEVFEAAGRLDRFEGFASLFGADFYGLPHHEETITLIKESWVPPDTYEFGAGVLVPYRAGEPIGWRLAPDHA